VAFKRNHPNKLAILLLNIFLGLTLIGWVAAFIWSFMDTANKSVSSNTGDELQKLAALKEQGHLTDEEFNRKKQQLLNS
jgi:flagellar basal body-associated protein FliL